MRRLRLSRAAIARLPRMPAPGWPVGACSRSSLSSRAIWSPTALHASAPRIVLGIESSCDDTAVGIVTSDGRILGEAIAGQAEVHAAWGGIVPSLAQQAHRDAIDRVVDQALRQAQLQPHQLDAVAVTVGPGLSLCLEVGVRKARELARAAGLPLIPVHHMEAHALVARLPAAAAEVAARAAAAAPLEAAPPAVATAAAPQPGEQPGGGGGGEGSCDAGAAAAAATQPAFPFLCLLVSGGHNLLVLVRGVGSYLQLGTSVDDALGEAYDKVARMLGLPATPHGGAALEALARTGDPAAYRFAVPMARKPDCNFSYAGLKTSVRLAIERELLAGGAGGGGAELGSGEPPGTHQRRADMAASFQAVAVAHLVQRVRRGIAWAREAEPGLSCLVVAGGVAANQAVRAALGAAAEEAGLALVAPPPRLCTDNGVMVAWAGLEAWADPGRAPPARLPPLAAGEDPGGEWLQLRPRWPLTGEQHGRASTERLLSMKAPDKLAPSLTALTRAASSAGGGEGADVAGGAEGAAVGAAAGRRQAEDTSSGPVAAAAASQ